MTSQIFANIYLNEFDRYVRRELTPLAYLRYGDDVVLFAPNKNAASYIQKASVQFLKEMHLDVNTHNDIIVRVRDGLHFLGHRIYPNSTSVEPAMRQKIARELNAKNIASYQAMKLPDKDKKYLAWLVNTED